MKEGFFEWIASFEQLEALLPTSDIINRHNLCSLIIGGGTSLFSEKLAEKFLSNHARLISTDNDQGCVLHMQQAFPNSKVTYVTHDIIEDAGRGFEVGEFDFIFDKGTLDAINVEGSVAILVHEISRLLKIGGVYVLVSINSQEMLSELFAMDGLGLRLDALQTIAGTNNCSLALIRKVAECRLSVDEIGDLEEELMNRLFKAAGSSLLTEGKVQHIQQAFAASDDLPLHAAHAILFPAEEGLGYELDLFLEDLQGFPLGRADRMTAAEAIAFVQAME